MKDNSLEVGDVVEILRTGVCGSGYAEGQLVTIISVDGNVACGDGPERPYLAIDPRQTTAGMRLYKSISPLKKIRAKKNPTRAFILK